MTGKTINNQKGKGKIYCSYHFKDCNYTPESGRDHRISKNHKGTYICSRLDGGTCDFLLEQSINERIANALEILAKSFGRKI